MSNCLMLSNIGNKSLIIFFFKYTNKP